MRNVIIVNEYGDIIVRQNVIAVKTWTAEDIEGVLLREGYEDSDENVRRVLSHDRAYGDLDRLEDDCLDQEWNLIESAIKNASAWLKKRMQEED